MKNKNQVTLAILDFILCLITGIVSHVIVTGTSYVSNVPALFLLAGFFILTMLSGGVYHLNIGVSSMEITRRLMVICIIDTSVTTVLFGLITGFGSLVTRWIFLFCLFSFCASAFVRYIFRVIHYESSSVNKKLPSAVIYGAGELGVTMARLAHRGKFDYRIIGFIDDNPAFKKDIIINYPVFGGIDNLEAVLTKYKPSYLIIAITKISSDKIQKAIQTATDAGCHVKIVPNLFETKGRADVSLREIDYADLLGRSLDIGDRRDLCSMFNGKTVLVTGAGGSIGSEISRQLADFDVSRLILLDIDETELHNLSLLLNNYDREWSERIIPVVCDIRNSNKLTSILKKYSPDIVFHAAAYKHVPLMELYPEEALETNICGSYNLFDACDSANVSKVVVISTDKAVNPTNAMGATKRVVEMLASAFNSISKTDFCCVRFGNVIGSRGSMLPLFIDEIKVGKPITVTDKNIIRYFMAIPEAVGLVLRAANIAEGGNVMVLDMGDPVKIYDFAQKLIDLYGDGRSTIKIIGLRPGEKLYEELLANKDNTIPTSVEKIFMAKVLFDDRFTKPFMQNLITTIKNNSYTDAKELLQTLVPEYKRQ